MKAGNRTEINDPDNNIVVKVTGLSKSFKLPLERSASLKGFIFNLFHGARGYKKHQVLKNVDFEIKRGDFVGIVGRNGSGKSTLLKILAGVYHPEGGEVIINGSLIPFIELGVGFNPELTGRENVYLNGSLLGFSNKEMDAMYDEIVRFAELEDFMDQKLKNFSSGMQVRLAFSIAIKAQGDILVLDEVLAVGDEAFQNKCNQFFDKIKKDKTKTVILVTHSMSNVRKYCNRGILIHDGVVKIDGSPEDVSNSYSLENSKRYSNHDLDLGDNNESIVENFKVKLSSPGVINQNDAAKIDVYFETKKDMKTYVAITLWDIVRGQSIMNSNAKDRMSIGKNHHFSFSTTLKEINDTNIRAYVSVRDENGTIIAYGSEDESPTFIMRRTDYPDPKNKTIDAILFNRGEYKTHEKKAK